MQGVIAIEKTLSSLAETLETEGYKVIDLDEDDVSMADAILVSGADSNLMDIQTVENDVPVIDVSGKTANEIIEELSRL